MSIKVVFFDIGNTLVSGKQWLPGAKEIISEFKASQIRVGLISNTGQLTPEELAERLPADFSFDEFDEGITLLSSEVGIEKPARAIFSLAIQHADVSPWEAIFVGESLTETVAAQSAGMRAARITNSESDYPELLKQLTG